MPDILLAELEARNPDARPIVGGAGAPPFTCHVCGGIYEPAIVDEATGRVMVPGHIPALPPMCSGRLPTLTGSSRDARSRRAGRRTAGPK